MATVMVTIDEKTYRMACDEGQESHLAGLAQKLNRYIGHLKSSFGEIGDHRLSVMAGIMVMDEMSELEKRFANLKEENQTLQATQEMLANQAIEHKRAVAAKLDQIAQRIIVLASRITPRN
ncbi:MAG: cell division protein ZapA [Candidatus Tokpelaia sp. JSC188]|nr:MAG: cell division protein ZapA [Candidatus Tokpelaia sp. JSC188]